MNRIRKSAVLCLMFAPLAYGVAGAADSSVDQVIVEADRATLTKLAREVQLAEQRFYARYNELNTRRKYAVRCYEEAATGTRFKQKYCKPVYETEAQATQGREFILALGRGAAAGSTSGGAVASSGVMGAGGFSGGAGIGAASGTATGAQATSTAGAAPSPGGTTTEAFVDIDSGRPEFQKNVIEVARKHPDLMKLLKEHAEVRQRYDELYEKLNGRAPDAYSRGTSDKTPENP